MNERHLPDELMSRLDREIDRDRRYEARRPDRQFWCRRAGKAEEEAALRLGGVRTPPGMRTFIAVRRIAPGVRMHSHFFAGPGFEFDMPEYAAESVTPEALR